MCFSFVQLDRSSFPYATAMRETGLNHLLMLLMGGAPQSKAQMNSKFLEIETSIKSKINQVFFQFSINVVAARSKSWISKMGVPKKLNKMRQHILWKCRTVNLLTCRIILKDIRLCFLSLASIVQSTKAT